MEVELIELFLELSVENQQKYLEYLKQLVSEEKEEQ